MPLNPHKIATAVCLSTVLAIILITWNSFSILELDTYRILSSNSADPQCPSPFTPRYDGFDRSLTWPDTAISKDRCQRLDVLEGQPFAAIVCPNRNRCNSVSLFVKPTTCNRSPGRELSADSLLNEELQSLGGFEFRLSVQGAEMWSTGDYRFDPQECVYRFDVALQNSGWAAMNLAVLYQNWTAFDEMVHEGPINLNQQLLTQPYTLPSCVGCPRYYAPAVIPGKTLIGYTESDAESVSPVQATFGTANIPALSEIPSCDVAKTRDPVRGSFLPFPPVLSSVNFFAHRPGGFAGTHAFVPQHCMYRHPGMRFADHADCVKGREATDGRGSERKILVIGDSHARVLYDGMAARLQGKKDYNTRSDKAGHRHAQIGQLYMNFTWDPKLTTVPTCEDVETWDGIAISVGHHPATDVSVAQWEGVLDGLDQISNCPNVPRLVFVTPPPQPPRTDTWAQKMHDRRTCSRLKRFGQIAQERALATSTFSVVNQYDLLEPFIFHPLQVDGAHFIETDGLEAVIDETIGKLGICGMNEILLPEPSIEVVFPDRSR